MHIKKIHSVIYSIVFLFCLSSCIEETKTVASGDLSNESIKSGSTSQPEHVYVYPNIKHVTYFMGVPYEGNAPSGFEQDDKKTTGNYIMYSLAGEFVRKGGRLSFPSGKSVTGISYIEVPLRGLYRHSFGDGSYWDAGLGPYISYAVGGSIKSTFNGQTTTTKIFDGTSYRHLDAGLGLGAEYELANHVSVGVNYDLGLANLSKGSGVKVRNRSFAIELGYSWGRLWKR